jgi:death-on-curing protein
MKRLTVKMVEQLSFFLAQEFMAYDEPIPDFLTRFPNILESCLASPFQWFSGRPLYRGFVSKASVLFYLMLKNHPFQNGNKRLAITSLLVFLRLNGKWMNVNLNEFYDFAVCVAASPPSERDAVLESIKKFIRDHIAELRPR